MKLITNIDLPLSIRRFSKTAHFLLSKTSNGGIAILRPYENDVLVLDANFHVRHTFSFRDTGAEPHSLSSNNPIFLPHCITPGNDDALLIYDPVAQTLVSFDTAGKLIAKNVFPFQISSFLAQRNELLVWGRYNNHFLHSCSQSGSINKSILPISDYNSDIDRMSLQSGSLLAAVGDDYGVICDTAHGLIEFRAQASHDLTLTVAIKNKTTIPITQLVAQTPQRERGLIITWPGLPIGAKQITKNPDGSSFLILSGSGKHFITCDVRSRSIRYFELPNFNSQMREVIAIESSGEHFVVGTAPGEIWAIEQSAVKEITREEFSVAINRPYAVVRGMTLGPAAGFVLSDDDIQTHRSLWEHLSGSFALTLEADRTGHVISAIPTNDTQENPEMYKSICQAFRSMHLVTHGDSLLQDKIKVFVTISSSAGAVRSADRRVLTIT